MSIVTFVVEPIETNCRLDQFLAQRLVGHFSRTLCKRLILEGYVDVSRDPAYRLKAGDIVGLTYPQKESIPDPQLLLEPVNFPIMYEDKDLLVLEKPAGLVVHPAPGHQTGTLAQILSSRYGGHFFLGRERAGIVHRLDKDTSGLMVVAKNEIAQAHLAAQFAAHGHDGCLERYYQALIWGTLIPTQGTIAASIGRHRIYREKMTVTQHPRARHAITHYHITQVFENGAMSAVTCRLETGRTHQIRVHMALRGTPVIGDKVYSKGFETKRLKLPTWAQDIIQRIDRQALHACFLSFIHPTKGERLTFSSPWPQPLMTIASQLKLV